MGTRGLFVTMEGGEGVGKSTNLVFLEKYLSDHGVDLIVTREPGGTQIGEDVRKLLLQVRSDRMSVMTELLLIFAARAQHISELIEPALASGKWVLCDRFTDATYAYQSGGRGVPWEAIRRLEELVQVDLRPDYTLLLDVSAEVGMARARGRGELDRIENETIEFFERVRRNYLDQAQNSSGRYRLIDASLSLDEVHQQLLKIGQELLTCWNVRRHKL